MTKKHFEALAQALDPRYRQWFTDAVAVAAVCSKANPRFDCDRFVAACEGK